MNATFSAMYDDTTVLLTLFYCSSQQSTFVILILSVNVQCEGKMKFDHVVRGPQSFGFLVS